MHFLACGHDGDTAYQNATVAGRQVLESKLLPAPFSAVAVAATTVPLPWPFSAAESVIERLDGGGYSSNGAFIKRSTVDTRR